MDNHPNSEVRMRGRFRLFPFAPVQPPLKEYKLTPEPADTEFRKEFPPDATIGSELDEAARVWKVYRKEAEIFDRALLQGWSETLDILLIFAGLFSAVATAFVIESYQSLQPDNAAYAATALYILVAVSNHSTGMTLPPPADLAYKSSTSRWINGLWFTSILLSLSVALLSILAKQWITEYRARNNASAKSPKDWALRREVYFQALNAWPVAEVVAFLPFLLHLSLFLFFAGVVVFLWTLDKAIGIWIILLGGSLALFYTACTILPLWKPESPTSTPLSKQMRTTAVALILTSLTVILAALHSYQRVKSSITTLSSGESLRLILTGFRDMYDRVRSRTTDGLAMTIQRFRRILHAHPSNPADALHYTVAASNSWSVSKHLDDAVTHFTVIRNDKSGADHYLDQNRDQFEAAAIHWLIVDVSDSDAGAVGLQALGAFHWNAPVVEILRSHDQLVDFSEESAFTRSSSDHTSTEVLRVVRSVLCMCRHGQSVSLYDRLPSLNEVDADYPDLGLLCAQFHSLARGVAFWQDASRFLASTALHALRAENHPYRLANLVCCDLNRFSNVDWDIAWKAATQDDIDVDLTPRFAKPFSLAVIIAWMWKDSVSVEHTWVDPLIRKVLDCVRWPDEDIPDSINLLSTFVLDVISSERFLDVIPPKRIATILSYFLCNVDRVMRDATADSIVQFWAAFTSLACRMVITLSPFYTGTSDEVLFMVKCAATLRKWGGSEAIRSAVFDAILLPPRVAAPVSTPSERGWFGPKSIEIADALAATLCISVRDCQETTVNQEFITA